MPPTSTRAHKHFRLDAVKIKRAQRVLRAGTETEAIERALDLVISEHQRNRLAAEANERFVKSGISIRDVYATLEQQMQPALFDTSIYITALRMRGDAGLGLRRIAGGAPTWLSSVVLEELYAGVSDRSRPTVERLERDLGKAGRILVPNLMDWTQTGRVLALLPAKCDYEQIGKGRLTNDALIAMSAGRLGITVITANARDFGRLAEFRPFQWRVENPRTN